MRSRSNATLYLIAAGTAWAVAACGGSGGGGSDSPASSASSSLASTAGTYTSGCVAKSATESEEYTLVVGSPVSASAVTANLSAKKYTGSNACAPAQLSFDLTFGGQLTALPGTKSITIFTSQGNGAGKYGTASTATFRLDSMTLSIGTLSIPTPTFGTTVNVGYRIEGSSLYSVVGAPQADGLGGFFDSVVLTKQ